MLIPTCPITGFTEFGEIPQEDLGVCVGCGRLAAWWKSLGVAGRDRGEAPSGPAANSCLPRGIRRGSPGMPEESVGQKKTPPRRWGAGVHKARADLRASAGSAGQDPEEGLDVGVG